MEEMNADEWIEILAKHDNINERHMLCVFALFGYPPTMLDVGCGTGAMVNVARKLGIQAFGVDIICTDDPDVPRYRPWLFQHDLTETFSLSDVKCPSPVNLVTCIEVAEHLPPEKDETICNTIANHVERGGMLIFTSACPGQGGEIHKGIRPAPHWRKKFDDRGLSYQRDLTSYLMVLWRSINSPLYWLPGNLQIFFR